MGRDDRAAGDRASASRASASRASGDRAAELAELLPQLALALYESAPHHDAARVTGGAGLTARQTKAVVFLAHRGPATMGEFAAGLQISSGAATELAARLVAKGVVQRKAVPGDRRKILLALAAPADHYASETLARWRRRLRATFARFPDLDPDRVVAFLQALITDPKGRSAP